MSMSSTQENAVLKALLKGTDFPYRGNATMYIALFSDNAGTAADLAAGNYTYELTYTPYARVALTKASAWSDNGANYTNAGLIQFAQRTDAAATVNALWFSLVDTVSGAYTQGIYGQLNASLPISQNIQPQFNIGAYTEY